MSYPQSMFWSGAKIRKMCIPLHIPVVVFFYIKVGFKKVKPPCTLVLLYNYKSGLFVGFTLRGHLIVLFAAILAG